MFIRSVYAANLREWFEPAQKISNPTLGGLAGPLINNVIVISGVFTLLVLIFAGFNYITGAGDKQKVAQAQNMLTYALVGLVLIVAAYMITNLLFTIVGYQLF